MTRLPAPHDHNSKVVHHFGPDPATVGGMATVIRVLAEHQVGGDVVDSHPTWKPKAPLATARMFLASARALLKMPAGQVAHVHLSERGSFLREGSLVAVAHRRGLVTVATIHGASFMPFARRYPWLVSTVLRRADLIACFDQTRSTPRNSMLVMFGVGWSRTPFM